MSYLCHVKQIELEARFNLKLGHRDTIKVELYLEYLPHTYKFQISCKCEIPSNDNAYMCCVELDQVILTYVQNKKILYQHEDKILDELVNIYLDNKRELEYL